MTQPFAEVFRNAIERHDRTIVGRARAYAEGEVKDSGVTFEELATQVQDAFPDSALAMTIATAIREKP